MASKGTKTKRIKSLWDNLSNTTQNIAKFISACGVIMALALSAGSWLKNAIVGEVQLEIVALRESIADNRMAISRSTLYELIAHDPTNIVSIEEEAVTYFRVLHGDTYMRKIYSDWAREYGGDLEIVIGVD